MSSSQKNSNRLLNEKSPYLLQHAYNPIDWYPWCGEAFEKAQNENKPIFLSIGYSTCHWCHVMEKESFEDNEIAEMMNNVFVSIKVDREERPDIDNIYMMACQMMTGSGGWPLTIIMTPDKKPFFCGTYFPKENRFGRIGLKELIKNINQAWLDKRKEIEQSANEITNYLHNNYSSKFSAAINSDILKTAYKYFENHFDSINGGFGKAPKFPSPHNLIFLLRYWKRTDEQYALDMVAKTLSEMRNGGIFDHVGFGFHRYSTDEHWLVPHFEKMLYDQALLAIVYTEAYQATNNYEFKKTTEEIFTYVLRDMTSPDCGFFSAEDADSEGVEGKFYLWKEDEMFELLGKDAAEFTFDIFSTNPNGNFQEEASATHENILHLKQSIDQISLDKYQKKNYLNEKLESIRKILFEAREKRVHPFKDDKILTDWNGLMIASLAISGRAFNNEEYISVAEKCFTFINKNLFDKDGKLLHRFRNGEAKIFANLDDYAFLIWGLIELYESTFRAEYITRAVDLLDFSLKHFWDSGNGGFFFTPDYGEKLIVKTKEIYDSAIPSGNSVMLNNLLRLSRITSNDNYESKAQKLIDCFSENVSKAPAGSTFLLSSFDFLNESSSEIIIVGQYENIETQNIIKVINQHYIPGKVIILHDINNPLRALPFNYLQSYSQIDSRPTIYVCKNFQCKLPTTNIKEALNLLGFSSL